MKKWSILLLLVCVLLSGCAASAGTAGEVTRFQTENVTQVPTGMAEDMAMEEQVSLETQDIRQEDPGMCAPEEAPAESQPAEILPQETVTVPEEVPIEIGQADTPQTMPEAEPAPAVDTTPKTDDTTETPTPENTNNTPGTTPSTTPNLPQPSVDTAAKPETETDSAVKPTTGATSTTNSTTNSPTTGANVPSSYNPPSYPKETDNDVLMFRYDTVTIPLGSSQVAEVFYFGNGTLRWYALNPALVSVDANGRITPLWDGNFIIYVTDGTYTDSIYVKVPATGSEIAPTFYFENAAVELQVGQTMPLRVEGSLNTHLYAVTYTSSDDMVVGVNTFLTKELRAYNPGTAVITANCAGHRATMVVTVVPAPQVEPEPELELTHSSLNLRVNGQFQLHPYYSGSGTLEWVSMNPDIVQVKNNGLVTAVGEGVGTFYVTDGELTVYCQVYVKPNGEPFF